MKQLQTMYFMEKMKTELLLSIEKKFKLKLNLTHIGKIKIKLQV
nr:MAG TPA: hypothetical protein [Caudoviricetes sp.]